MLRMPKQNLKEAGPHILQPVENWTHIKSIAGRIFSDAFTWQLCWYFWGMKRRVMYDFSRRKELFSVKKSLIGFRPFYCLAPKVGHITPSLRKINSHGFQWNFEALERILKKDAIILSVFYFWAETKTGITRPYGSCLTLAPLFFSFWGESLNICQNLGLISSFLLSFDDLCHTSELRQGVFCLQGFAAIRGKYWGTRTKNVQWSWRDALAQNILVSILCYHFFWYTGTSPAILAHIRLIKRTHLKLYISSLFLRISLLSISVQRMYP